MIKRILSPGEVDDGTKRLLLEDISRWGNHSLAYSTLQEGMSYFVLPGKGFLGFAEITSIPLDRDSSDPALQFRNGLMGLLHQHGFVTPNHPRPSSTVHVLSNPVTDKSFREELIGSFLQVKPHACFWQTDTDTSQVLERFGYKTNHFGFETTLDLKEFTLDGKEKENLRASRNKASSLEYNLRELNPSEVNWDRIHSISDEWIKSKTSDDSEIAFLARPMMYGPERDVRIFGGFDKTGEMQGYVVFDPIYEEGKVTGYLKDKLRNSEKAKGEFKSRSLTNALTVKAINAFQEEGKSVLSLGLSPFYGVSDNGEGFNPSTSLVFAGIYGSANHLYGFQRLAYSKEIYRGQKNRVFFNSREALSIDQVVDMFRVCRVLV